MDTFVILEKRGPATRCNERSYNNKLEAPSKA